MRKATAKLALFNVDFAGVSQPILGLNESSVRRVADMDVN
jgi:hypothetical protein